MTLAEELAALFRETYRPYAFGRFSVPSGETCTTAAAQQRVIWARGPDGALGAAALLRPVRRALGRRDFTGREVVINVGAVLMDEFAAREAGAAARVAMAAAARAAKMVQAMWCSIHEENALVKAAVTEAGFSYVATQVLASSELRGLYALGAHGPTPLPASEAATLVTLPTVLDPGALAAVATELAQYEATGPWMQHYSNYNRRHSWTAFALRGFDPDPGFIIKPAEMSKAWKAANPARLAAPCGWTAAAAHFPRTCALAERLAPAGVERVRFMQLRPTGALSRHADITDREAGTADGKIVRLHLPIMTSPACVFHAWTARGEELRRHLPADTLHYLDTRKPHAVENGDRLVRRVHFVIDAVADGTLRAALAA